MKLNEHARIMRALAIPSKAGTLIHHLRSDQKETMLAATEASVFAQPAGTQKIGSLGRSYVIDYTGYRTMRICCMYMYVYTVLYSMYLNVRIKHDSPITVWHLGTLLAGIVQPKDI